MRIEDVRKAIDNEAVDRDHRNDVWAQSGPAARYASIEFAVSAELPRSDLPSWIAKVAFPWPDYSLAEHPL